MFIQGLIPLLHLYVQDNIVYITLPASLSSLSLEACVHSFLSPHFSSTHVIFSITYRFQVVKIDLQNTMNFHWLGDHQTVANTLGHGDELPSTMLSTSTLHFSCYYNHILQRTHELRLSHVTYAIAPNRITRPNGGICPVSLSKIDVFSSPNCGQKSPSRMIKVSRVSQYKSCVKWCTIGLAQYWRNRKTPRPEIVGTL